MEYALDAVRHIRIGWNLGNSLDSCGLGNVSITKASASAYETQWGNPVADEMLFHTIRELGYRAVRLPVTWFEHLDQDDTIDGAWMERVRELVDLILQEGLYCIINVHHDTGAGQQAWLRADYEQYDQWISRFIRIWEQIADTFCDYGERLLFEGFNEMLDAQSRWDYTDAEGYDCINRYNQTFVNTIRSSAGNNKERNLILNTYGASPMEPAAQHFVLPEDLQEGHLMVGVHFYKPDAFSAGNMEYFREDGEQEVDTFMERMQQRFIAQGIPVIMGECGTHNIRKEEERARYARYVITRAIRIGMAYLWWDDGDVMRLLDRSTKEVVYRQLQEEITNAALEQEVGE